MGTHLWGLVVVVVVVVAVVVVVVVVLRKHQEDKYIYICKKQVHFFSKISSVKFVTTKSSSTKNPGTCNSATPSHPYSHTIPIRIS